MTDQKCPMCGKLNPPELDECQFCHARLKPLIVNQPDEDQSPTSKPLPDSAPDAESSPDWLRSLRDHQDDVNHEPDEEGLPTWPIHEEDERPGLPTGDDATAPDWLDNLRGPGKPDESNFSDTRSDDTVGGDDGEDIWTPLDLNSDDEAAVPDWLSGVRADTSDSDQDAESSADEMGDAGPDWLERIRARQQAEKPETETTPEQPRDMPDWLRAGEPASADAMTDWPSSSRDRADEAPTNQEQAASELPEGLPDWMLKEGAPAGPASEDLAAWLEQEEETTPSAADEVPDWLDGEDEQDSSPDEFPDWLETGDDPNAGQESGSGQLDWMNESSQQQEPGKPEKFDWLPNEEALPADDVPDWLQTTDDTGDVHDVPGETAADTSAGEPASVEGLPGWLQQIDQDEAAAQPDEIPDWVSETSDETASPEGIPDWLQPETESTGPEGEIPDWLSDVSREEELPEESLEANSAAELPDWLAGLDHEVQADVAEASREEATAEQPSEDLPDWLAGSAPAADESNELPEQDAADSAITLLDGAEEDQELPAYGLDDAFEDEVPDWLADVKVNQEREEQAAEKPAGSKEADLAPAELPSWLEAMRPVEAEATPEVLDERDQQVVNAGPLAGLRGVLPAEPEISKVQKPPTYSVKLQVSDMQQERAAMLEELVQAEGESRPIPKRPLVSSQHILRVVFAIILFLAVLWPLVAKGPVAPIPVFSPETGAANQLIGQLNSQAPVLVAVDYQPGLSGEMDAIATTLLDHFMLRGAYLTLVSTTASGPIQAEHVLSLANQEFGHSYLGASEYTNLGYIPGGPTGLISFAANPRAMMAYALDDGRPAWQDSPLGNVQNLSDFALVTVLTENPETARAWIEQVQPALGDTPLIMAISAQAEPMVRPYYEAFPKQVQGMVVGLAGSAAYESLMGHPGLAHDYWNSFGIGLLVALVLILVGGLYNTIPIFLHSGRDKSMDREGSR